jgi:REP element-mobilizing transposase RayT
MARPHRDVAPGIFHVTSHAVRSTELFTDDVERLTFIGELAGMAAKLGWTVIAVVLMNTHYHLIVETADLSLADGMHRLNFRYACRFNSIHRLRGHVLEARYFSKRIGDDAQLIAAYAYVARNPVKAGLCAKADDWPWSSYAALVNGTESFTFVDASRILELFGGGEDARERLRLYVDREEAVAYP